MPRIRANDITIHYEEQGEGEPLVLIPYLTADHACYAFQVQAYAEHFRCISMDLRGTGESDKTGGDCSTELFADDVAAFMDELGIGRAHVSGLSLGAGIGLWVAAKYPDKVASLSVHGGWHETDPFLQTVIEGWQVSAKALGSIPELVVKVIFPWCFTPELYANRTELLQQLSDFVRSRPAQPVEEFLEHTKAVIGHDVAGQLGKIRAPTLITVGDQDRLTSIRFAGVMHEAIARSELHVFENAAHAPLYEKLEEFNEKTLEFLRRNAGRK